MNDLLIERLTGFPDGPHVREKLNELIDKHNALVSRLIEPPIQHPYPPEPVKPVQVANKSADVYDWLVGIGFICRCVASVSIPCPKVPWKPICRECGKPIQEEDD